jgi:FlaA1/EpsC-like NDP-sugar epimerase
MTHLEIANLLGRDAASVAVDPSIVAGKRVLVTGAGGSIGSELCRQVAACGPAMLVLMERSEPALASVNRQALCRRFPRLVDVTDRERTLALVAEFRPHIVIHTAAHKHVDLLEDNHDEAYRNNVGGTESIFDASAACGVERFILISTDKAVNPSCVMGRTKRDAERYVASAERGAMQVGVVRFGNVAGSSGSVLEVWERQWAETQTIDLTDVRMTRYFLTIPEAAGLVLNTLPMLAGEPTLFMLDMGPPRLLLVLARRFLNARGAGPGHIRHTGIRPGEKLHEELHYADEELTPTAHPRIRSCPMRAEVAA